VILGMTAEYNMNQNNADRLHVLIVESENRLHMINLEIEQIELELHNKEERLNEARLKYHEEREFNNYIKTLINHNRGNTDAY